MMIVRLPSGIYINLALVAWIDHTTDGELIIYFSYPDLSELRDTNRAQGRVVLGEEDAHFLKRYLDTAAFPIG